MKRVALLSVGPAEVRSGVRTRGGEEWLDARPYQDGADLTESVELLFLHRALRGARRAEVVLRRPVVQLRTLRDLPPVPGDELAALVRRQPNRFFRRRPGPLLVDAVWVDGPKHRSEARAAAAEAWVVEAVFAATDRLGVRVLSARPDDDVGSTALSLLTPEARVLRTRTQVRQAVLLAASVATIWAAAGLTYGFDVYRDYRSVSAELDRLNGPLAQMERVRAQLMAVAIQVAALERQGPSAAWATAQLARISEVVPRSAHVVALEATQPGRIRIEGRAADALEVLKALESVPPGIPRFEHPPQPEDGEGRKWDRFTIVMEAG